MQIIQTKLATDASAIESRVIRAMSLLQKVPLMFSIHALFFMLRQGDKDGASFERTFGIPKFAD